MPKREYRPPPVCDACHERPALGDTLWHSGVAWLCPACLTEQAPGNNPLSKAVKFSLEAEQEFSRSRRAKAAGDIEAGINHGRRAQWRGHASDAVLDHGQRAAASVEVRHGEALSVETSWLKDTLSDPDLPAVESSRLRGQLLEANDVTALAIDVSNTAGAGNTVEKLLAHQLALAHKIAFEQANKASHERDPKIELKRLQVSARMMVAAQDAAEALQQVKKGAPQRIVVQHVTVEAGGQAVVGNVRSDKLR